MKGVGSTVHKVGSESIAPDIFELGDADVVQIADGEVPPDREIDVRAAVDQCPKAALRLVD